MSKVVKLRTPEQLEGRRLMQSFVEDEDDFETLVVVGIRKDGSIEYGHTLMERSQTIGLLEILKYCIMQKGDERADV